MQITHSQPNLYSFMVSSLAMSFSTPDQIPLMVILQIFLALQIIISKLLIQASHFFLTAVFLSACFISFILCHLFFKPLSFPSALAPFCLLLPNLSFLLSFTTQALMKSTGLAGNSPLSLPSQKMTCHHYHSIKNFSAFGNPF